MESWRHLSSFTSNFYFRFSGRHLEFGNQPTSRNVGIVRDVSDFVVSVDVAVGIVPPAHCVQMLFPLPVLVAAILNSVVRLVDQRRKMSGNVGSVASKSGLVENTRIAV